jgi:hypothetical protein
MRLELPKTSSIEAIMRGNALTCINEFVVSACNVKASRRAKWKKSVAKEPRKMEQTF